MFKNSISLDLPLSIHVKFSVIVIVLLFLSFILINISVNHLNELVICLKLPYIIKLDSLSLFYLNILIAKSFIPSNLLLGFKKELEIIKLFILQCKYYKDKNHLSDFFDFFSKPFEIDI